ncbi:MAG: chlorophyll synthesis pathway protein BchC [Luminiphilus sp.]|nr:chlorophyll synthesis pathway protein BchC [Luminiphilus sp.]
MSQVATAVVFESPGNLSLREVGLPDCDPTDCLVEVDWSGISTGTERLLWDGRMPPFPGLDYPLVPGYESVGRVLTAGSESTVEAGSVVFVPGSRGFQDVAGLFGGAAKQLVVDSKRLVPLQASTGSEGVLLALIATAVHAIKRFENEELPQLIVGHGVLGRLVARICVALGAEDLCVWEQNPARRDNDGSYRVLDPSDDSQSHYHRICDVSGDSSILGTLLPHLSKTGCIVLAGFYHKPLQFDFPVAFMAEATLRIAAEWQPSDLELAQTLLQNERIIVEDLITHQYTAQEAAPAYDRAFSDPYCLKMILDWRSL